MNMADHLGDAPNQDLIRARAVRLCAFLCEVFDGPDAARWPKKRLGVLLSLRKEIVPPRDRPKGPALFVGLEHIATPTGLRTGAVEVEMSKLTGRKPRFYTGDIVYGYLRPYLNKVWVAEFDGLCSVDQYVYSVDQAAAQTSFVAWFMRSPVFLGRAPITTWPGQLPRIRTDEVASMEIDLPPLREQHRLAATIGQQMKDFQHAPDAIACALDAVQALPSALLRAAFGGQL